jgi:hypothetical protein
VIQEINILGDDSIGLCEKKNSYENVSNWMVTETEQFECTSIECGKRKEISYCYFKLIFNVMFKRQASYNSQ